MNTKNLVIASLIGAVVTAFLANVPVINLLNCLVCLPLWGGPLLATWFYRRQTGTLPMEHAIGVGILTGVFAGLFGILFGLLGMAGTSELINQANQYLPQDSIPPALFTGATALFVSLIGILINVVFGVIGGLIGGAIFKDKAPAAQA